MPVLVTGAAPCHPNAQPKSVVWKPPANNVTLLGCSRSRMAFLAQKCPGRPPKGCPRNSHAPRSRVSRGLRNHRAAQAEKPQRFTAPARPHTAGRLKSQTQGKAPDTKASWKINPATAGSFHVSYCTNALQSDLRDGNRPALIPAEVGPFEFQKCKARSAQRARYMIPSKCTVKVPR